MNKNKFIKEVLEIEEKYIREKGQRMQAVNKIISLLDKEWDNDTEKTDNQ